MSLKEKTIRGLSWSFVDNSAAQILTFIITIILARLIDPSEYGIVGYIVFFVAISSTFIDSGFTTALIRKKDCTQTDCCTVFFYNLIIGAVLYLLLSFFAPLPVICNTLT